MARGLIGKAIRGAASGLNQSLPLIQENQRQKNRMELQGHIEAATAKRDKVLAQYRQQEQAQQNEFVSGENQADRDLRQDQSHIENSFALARLGNDSARTRAQLEQIQVAVESSKLDLEDRQRLNSLITRYGQMDPDQREDAVEEMLLLQGKDPRLENEFRVVKQFDDLGNANGEVLVELSPTGSAHRRIDVNNMGGPDDGGGIPQAAIQELLSDPSAQTAAEFDEIFGAGAAEQILGQAPQQDDQSADQASVSQPDMSNVQPAPASFDPPVELGRGLISGPPELLAANGRMPSRLQYPSRLLGSGPGQGGR